MRISSAFLVASLTLGCAADEATVMFVTVNALDGVSAPRALEVTTHYSQDKIDDVLTRSGSAGIKLPASFVIKADGREGPVAVAVKAVDHDGRLVGHGDGKSRLVPGQRIDLTVVLHPADFQINTGFKNNQIFSLESSGRQIAAAQNGRFAVVWENQSAALTRFDVLCRMFDSKGAPRKNAATGEAKEFRTSPDGTEYFDHPALAMQRGGGVLDGHFVITWLHSPAIGGVAKIRSQAFAPDGKPDSKTGAGAEQVLSAPDAAHPAVPDIDVLTSMQYVAVWQQRTSDDKRWQVMGRLMDSHGRPVIMPPNIKNAPFEVASFARQSSPGDPAPVVAGGRDGGFMVAWIKGGNVTGSVYQKSGSSFTSKKQCFPLASIATGKAREVNLVSLPGGYAVIWSDTVNQPPDSGGACIRFRRFGFGGQSLEAEYTLNTSTAGHQRHPAMAVTRDGVLLAAWSSDHNSTNDPLGGVRGRVMLDCGLPVDEDFRINTTVREVQEKPSVAALTSKSFAAAFIDHSGAGPDTQGSGIRGILLYPDLKPRTGKIGALCDGESLCGTGLRCKTINAESRCLASCSGPSGSCLHGGKCTKDSAGSGYYCLY